MNFYRILACLMVGMSLTMLGACGSSHWQRSLLKGPETAPAGAATEAVRVREVQWDRVQATLQEMRQIEAANEVHPDEWSPEAKQLHKSRLIQGLQISEPATAVFVLGKSEFKTTDSGIETEEAGGELRRVARSLGADTVVWSRRLVGKADRVVQEPVTTYSSGTWWWREGDRRRPESFNEQQTTWVPVRVQADETAYIAFFLRTR